MWRTGTASATAGGEISITGYNSGVSSVESVYQRFNEEICHGFEVNMHESMPEFVKYSTNEGIDSCILAEKT